VGLAVSALTGLALFVGHAEVVYRSAYFGAHVALAVLALFNVAILQRVMAGNAKEHAPARSGRARVLAVVDLALWTGVIALPRLMS
jgi:hypothetical protein